MLQTNPLIYKRVLNLQGEPNEAGKLDWGKFFDSKSIYKLLYTLQIFEAIMEEGEKGGLAVTSKDDGSTPQKKKVVVDDEEKTPRAGDVPKLVQKS